MFWFAVNRDRIGTVGDVIAHAFSQTDGFSMLVEVSDLQPGSEFDVPLFWLEPGQQ